MEIRQLKNAVAVADCKCFWQAAAKLSISQPALSISIRNLEREVGAEIFVRARKEVMPTEFGTAFLAHARSVLREVEKTRELIDVAKAGRTRVVRIGVDSLLAGAVATGLLPRFHGEFANVRVEFDVATGTTAEALARISSGAWDFGVVLAADTISIAREFKAEICARLTTFPYARRKHPLAGRRVVPLEALAEQTWAISTRTSGIGLTSACSRHGLRRPHVAARINSFETIKDLVESTDWVTFLPSEIVDREPGSRFARLYNPELEFHTNVLLVQSSDAEATLPARALAELIAGLLRKVR